MDAEPANWQAPRSQRQQGLSSRWRHFEQKWCRATMASWPAVTLLVLGWRWHSSPAPTMEQELWGSFSQVLWQRAWSQKACVHHGHKGEMCLREVLPLVGMVSTLPGPLLHLSHLSGAHRLNIAIILSTQWQCNITVLILQMEWQEMCLHSLAAVSRRVEEGIRTPSAATTKPLLFLSPHRWLAGFKNSYGHVYWHWYSLFFF